MTPTTVPFVKVPIKASILYIICVFSMAQSNHVNRNQSHKNYICGLSQFGPSKRAISSISFLLQPKPMILVLDKLTSRLEEVQNYVV